MEAAARDREWLEHSVAELRDLAPEAGEEQALAELRANMQKGTRLAEDIEAVGQLLDGSEGGLALLRQAARRLERIGGEHDKLGEALEALDRALIEASEAEDRLAAAAEALAFDPARLEEAETRLFEIRPSPASTGSSPRPSPLSPKRSPRSLRRWKRASRAWRRWSGGSARRGRPSKPKPPA
jgi:DNA repair protein RecN (Recombination protein N)